MANDGLEPTVPEPTDTPNQTKPPTLWWSPWRGVLQRVETGKGYRCLRDWSRIFDLPSDAVLLAPQDDHEQKNIARADLLAWVREQKSYIMNQRGVSDDVVFAAAAEWERLESALENGEI